MDAKIYALVIGALVRMPKIVCEIIPVPWDFPFDVW